MLGIACSECASIGSYRATSDAFFECLECHHGIIPEDLCLEPSEIWTVNDGGILGSIIDPAESLREMSIAIDEYMEADHDSVGQLQSLRCFRDAVFMLQGALEAGVPYPIVKK
ncbi:hypothetical protein ACFRKE_24950 [Kitasatospora indigofera]|uniref:hypothetical protein n=1 Tax=Kitasatospora indigofera TaxID=67307 RepID=UPI0036AB51A4